MNATEDRAPETALTAHVALDLELCKVCGICIELCPEGVFDRDKLGYPVAARSEGVPASGKTLVGA
ncbi:MAG: 4Fe-4S binding protein [Actinobacteria bacterium]|nr:4Fe-4S binding protein [Actinomycetota bacterium]